MVASDVPAPGRRFNVGSRQLRQLGGRAGWNLADQVVSSGTNLVLSLLVARQLSVEGFGAFAIALTIYSFLIGAARALITQPLVVRYAAAGNAEFARAARSAAGAATLLGLASGAVTVTAGLVIGGSVGSSLICIGVFLPGLLLQDTWRLVFFAQGRPSAAFVNDLVWCGVQFAAVFAFISLGHRSASAMLIGWGGAALLAAIAGIAQFGGRPQLRASVPWMRKQKDLLGYYAAGFFFVMGTNQVTMLLIGGFGGLADVGALRAAIVVLGPLNIAGYSLSAFAVPELSRRHLGREAAIKAALAISGLMVLGDLVWGLALLAIPDHLGVALLGDSWLPAQAVLPASLLGLVAIGTGFGANLVMVAHGYAKDSFWTSALLAPGFLVFGLTGLHYWGAVGAAFGLSLAQCIVVPVVWWRVLVRLRSEAVRLP